MPTMCGLGGRTEGGNCSERHLSSLGIKEPLRSLWRQPSVVPPHTSRPLQVCLHLSVYPSCAISSASSSLASFSPLLLLFSPYGVSFSFCPFSIFILSFLPLLSLFLLFLLSSSRPHPIEPHPGSRPRLINRDRSMCAPPGLPG